MRERFQIELLQLGFCRDNWRRAEKVSCYAVHLRNGREALCVVAGWEAMCAVAEWEALCAVPSARRGKIYSEHIELSWPPQSQTRFIELLPRPRQRSGLRESEDRARRS